MIIKLDTPIMTLYLEHIGAGQHRDYYNVYTKELQR